MDLRVGFATSDITPPTGTELCGFGWYIGRKSTAVLEPLLARALVFESGDVRGAIVACDLVGVTRDITRDARRLVQAGCAIPEENVIVCGTHTHSGPTTVDLIGWGEKHLEYLSGLPERIAGAAMQAAGRTTSARMEYGEAPVEGISFNREYAGGPTDPLLKVLRFVAPGARGDLLGFLANYSCHPVVMCAETTLISGDFVGLATNSLAAKLGAAGLFLQGSCGDQNSIYRFQPQDEALVSLRLLADRFADRIEVALSGAEPVVVDSVSVARRELVVPQSVPDRVQILRNLLLAEDVLKHDSLPDDIRRRFTLEKATHQALWERFDRFPLDGRLTELQAVRLGEVTLVTHPAELFFEYHRRATERLSPRKTLVVGYANDYIGYVTLPDRLDVSRRVYHYSAHFVPLLLGEFPYAADAGDVLVDAMVELARSCNGQRIPIA